MEFDCDLSGLYGDIVGYNQQVIRNSGFVQKWKMGPPLYSRLMPS